MFDFLKMQKQHGESDDDFADRMKTTYFLIIALVGVSLFLVSFAIVLFSPLPPSSIILFAVVVAIFVYRATNWMCDAVDDSVFGDDDDE